MTDDEKIAATIGKARFYWAICAVIAISGAVALVARGSMPWWYMIFLIPFCVVTYFMTLTAAFFYLTATLKQEILDNEAAQSKLSELQERIQEGTLAPGPELMKELEAAGLTGVLEPVEHPAEPIGTLDGQPIYEWVDHYNTVTKKKERFYFYGSAERTMPKKEPNKIYISLKGILYGRSLDD